MQRLLCRKVPKQVRKSKTKTKKQKKPFFLSHLFWSLSLFLSVSFFPSLSLFCSKLNFISHMHTLKFTTTNWTNPMNIDKIVPPLQPFHLHSCRIWWIAMVMRHQRWPHHISRRCRRFETTLMQHPEHQNAINRTKIQRYAVASVCERKCVHHRKTMPVIAAIATTKRMNKVHKNTQANRSGSNKISKPSDQSAQIKMKHNQTRSNQIKRNQSLVHCWWWCYWRTNKVQTNISYFSLLCLWNSFSFMFCHIFWKSIFLFRCPNCLSSAIPCLLSNKSVFFFPPFVLLFVECFDEIFVESACKFIYMHVWLLTHPQNVFVSALLRWWNMWDCLKYTHPPSQW